MIKLLVVTAAIAIPATVPLPVLSTTKAKAKTKAINFVSNEKQIMLAAELYLDDNSEVIRPLWMNVGVSGFVPRDLEAYGAGKARAVAGHSQRVNLAFFDGQVASVKSGTIGYHLV